MRSVRKGGAKIKMIQFLACKNKKRGFTLIELLVVIAIIGILATIVLVSLNTARAKARDARRSSDMHQIALAMEMQYDSVSPNAYPAITDGYNALTSIGTYLNPVPTDPSGNTTGTVRYYFSNGGASGTKYCVWVQLEQPATATYILSNPNGTKQLPAGTVPTASTCAAL